MYSPMDHQRVLHLDASRYILAAGGYGWGKTRYDIEDKIKHMLITPNGRTLLGAPTYPQLRGTIKKEFEHIFPMGLVRDIKVTENSITLVNGHEVIYRSFDDPHKLRSLNLSSFSILEGSGASYSSFVQLQNRLRNTAALTYKRDDDGFIVFHTDKEGRRVPTIEHDWRKGVIESNPDPGWILTEFLEHSGHIYLHTKELAKDTYNVATPNPAMSTHIVPTKANWLLPENYVEEQSVGKPNWWVRRYFYGSFKYAEGLVYPHAVDHVITPFPIPKTWKRLVAMDYGINDNTHFVFGALDPVYHRCYIYDELVMNRANVSEITHKYFAKIHEVPRGGFFCTPVMDQRSRSKPTSGDVKKTLGDLFEEEGAIFEPAQMNVDARVLRTNTLLELDQLFIFANCTGLIDEIKVYKFPEKNIDKPNQNTDKPIDKNNHGVNALEFLVMELPHNLEELDLSVYNMTGKRIRVTSREVLYPGDYHKEPQYYDPFSEPKKPSRGIHYGGDVDADVDFSDDPDSDSMFDLGVRNL